MEETTVKFFYIPSDTEKGKKYTVRIFSTGEVRCDCPGFVFGGHCKHIKKAIEMEEKLNEN